MAPLSVELGERFQLSEISLGGITALLKSALVGILLKKVLAKAPRKSFGSITKSKGLASENALFG